MQTYRLDSSLSNIKLLKWKIQIGSKISKGTVLFIFEKTQGDSKIEKYKSNIGGKTVLSFSNINEGDILTPECALFQYECSHQFIINDLCCDCGIKRASSSASLSMIHSMPKMKVEKEAAIEIAKNDLKNLLKNRKLVLLVDLDHTLIHTTDRSDSAEINAEGVLHYELQHRGYYYHTRFRPGYEEFLEKMSKLYELHIVTFGEREYARKIASFMDPNKKYFHDRILSRNELTSQTLKTDNLRSLFPCGDLMVAIIDDRDDVWDYAKNLVCVKPYVFFKNTGDINEPAARLSPPKPRITERADEEAAALSAESENVNPTNDTLSGASSSSASSSTETEDDYLVYLEDILRKVHDEYYRQYDEKLVEIQETLGMSEDEDEEIDESNLPDMKKVLPQMREQVLKNVCVTFSGVVPTDYDLYKQKCYAMAIALGAKVNKDLAMAIGDEQSKEPTTHLVAANYGTSKVHEAFRMMQLNKLKNFYIVQPEWLIECYQKWIRCDEKEFLLNKDYEYKNCLFHQEYNLYQQRKANKLQQGVVNKAAASSGSPKRSSSDLSNKAIKKQKSSHEAGTSRASSSVKFTLGSADSDDTTSSSSDKNENFNLTISNNELDMMDKEVDDEISNGSESSSVSTSKKHKVEHSLSSSSSNSSSSSSKSSSTPSLSDSSSSTDDDGDGNNSEGSVDDDMIKALERELE